MLSDTVMSNCHTGDVGMGHLAYITRIVSDRLTQQAPRYFKMPSTLKLLSNLIAASVDDIQAACDARGVPFPSLDEVFSQETEEIRNQPEVLKATGILVAAATQLIATARATPTFIASASMQVSAMILSKASVPLSRDLST